MSGVLDDDSVAAFPSVVENNMALAQISNRAPHEARLPSESALEIRSKNPAAPSYTRLTGGRLDGNVSTAKASL